MTWDDFRLRLRALLLRRRAERDLDDELRFHLEMEARKNQAAGSDPADAVRQALRNFGGLEQRREECRDARGTSAVENLARDLRYGIRVLRKSPVFTCVAIASLAIGIGANTAVFSLVDTVLLRTLPVRNPEELVVFGWSAKESPPGLSNSYSVSRGGGSYGRYHSNVFSLAMFDAVRQSGALAGVIGYSQMPRLILTVNGESVVAGGLAASGNYFQTLGVAMAAGRPLQSDDDQQGGIPAAVISYRLWERAFNADPSAVGKTVYINRTPHVIVGVTARDFFGVSVLGFHLVDSVDVTLPLSTRERIDPVVKGFPSWRDPKSCWVQMMGRLKPGSSTGTGAQLAPLVLGAMPQQTATFLRDKDPRVDVEPGNHGLDFGRAQFKDPFQVLAAVVSLTLLMACANLAGLLLARSTTRTREISIRLAVGAGRARLVRQLLVESALLAIGGAAGGLLLAWWGVHTLLAFTAGGHFAIPVEVRLDARVLGFTAAIAMLTTLLFGLAPALRATRVELSGGMKQAIAADDSHGRFGPLRALVALQIAVALLLVVGATLATRTLQNVRRIPLGFNARNLTVFSIDAGRNGYDPARRTALYTRLIHSFQTTAGVLSGAASIEIPMSGLSSGTSVFPEGSAKPQSTRLNGISQGFFETLRIPLVAGRILSARDMTGPPVAVINERAARLMFDTPLAVGRRFRWKANEEPVEIVGVVKDAKYDKVKGDAPATTYVPWTQTPWGKPASLGFTIATAGDAGAALAAIRRMVHEADPMLPLLGVKTMERQIDEAVEQERLLASLVSLFGIITLVLACVGLYGMMAYMVNRRTREIGVRVALGADRGDVIGIVARQMAATTAAGLAIGLPAAWAAGRFVESMLYGVKAHDAVSFAAAAGIVVVVSTLAATGPLRRALKIDPVRALRYE
jgi:predicted permease